MGKTYQSLDDLLNDCTVRVKTNGGHGTGFFIAPGLILTCAHVIDEAFKQNTPVSAYCNYNRETIEVGKIDKEDVFPDTYPDLALLHVDIHNHPCVLLGTEFHASTNFYSYGYTKDFPNGESTTVECEGTLEYGGTFIKLKGGQVKPGASGSPLLNKDTCCVCGMITNTRDRNSDLGGAGVSTETIFSWLPKLQKLNEEYQKGDKAWSQLIENIKTQELYKPVAVFEYKKPDEIEECENFVARDELIDQIEISLDKKPARVLLNGIAGIGKTTLAFKVASRHLSKNKGPVLWVEVGSATIDQIIESIADHYQDQGLKNFKGDVKSRVLLLRQLIEKMRITLLVLDNFAAHNIWLELVSAIHKDLPVLVTSRSHFYIGDFVDIDQFSPAQAFQLLENIVQKPSMSTDPDAAFLCELFGYHPLALKILGANMREVQIDSHEQRQLLEANPTQLRSELYEDRLWVLINESASNLDEIERETFLAFGYFPHNGITLEFLQNHLHTPTEKLRDALHHLLVRNLVERRPKTNYYFLQDIIFLYVRSLSRLREEDNKKLMSATLSYLEKHSLEYELIKQDIANIFALSEGYSGIELIQIMSWLTIGGYPEPGLDSYFENNGHPTPFLERLDKAIQICGKLEICPKGSLHYLLGKRGDAYFNMGDYKSAVIYYEEAIPRAPGKYREAVVTSVAAKAYALLGDHQKAQNYFQESYRIAELLKDELLLVSIMGQESLAVGEDWEKICNIAEKQIEIVQRILNANPSPLAYKHHFYALLNLGTARAELAKLGNDSFEAVLPILQQAEQVALSQKSDKLLAYAFDSLGDVYHYLNKKFDAKTSFEQALSLWKKLGMMGFYKELETRMQSLGYPIAE